MKVTDLEVFVVGNPPPGFGGRYFVFVKVSTDTGAHGYGEAYAATVGPSALTAVIDDVHARHLAERNPFEIERFWRRAYTAGYSGRPDLTTMAAISALEMACWDIIGKEVGRPVMDLLGGRVRDRLRAYTYLYPAEGDRSDVYRDSDLAAERALQEVDRGFTAVKFDPAGPYSSHDGRQPSLERLALSARFMTSIREAIGDRADILFGTHGQFTAAGAIRLARRLEPFDPMWLEEPVPADDPHSMARVAEATSIPIAAGERLVTKHEFARLLRIGAAAILQPNLGRCGGLLEAKKVAAIAEVHGALIAPHLYCGPIVEAANVQFAAGIPNFSILETIRVEGGFHDRLVRGRPALDEGSVIPPSRPGLGVELDEEVARAHPYDGPGLHLEVVDLPDPDRTHGRPPEPV